MKMKKVHNIQIVWVINYFTSQKVFPPDLGWTYQIIMSYPWTVWVEKFSEIFDQKAETYLIF